MNVDKYRTRMEQFLLFFFLACAPISVGLYVKGEGHVNHYPEACYVQVQK